MDNVNIEIQSSSDKAASGLDRLINTLSNLNTKLKSTIANSMNFKEKMNSFNFKNPFKNFDFKSSFKGFNNPFNNFNKDGNKSSQIMERLNKAGEIVGNTLQKITQRAARFVSTLLKASTLKIGIKGLDAAFGGVGGKLVNIGNNLHQVIKSFSKYTLALYGIRSAFYAVRNVSNEFLSSQNAAAQQLSANISYLKYALGGALKPVIEYLTNLIYSILKALQALIYGFFKINIFAGLTAKSYSGVTKGVKDTNKELQKQLQGFDELNNITLETAKNTGAGSGGGGGATPTFDLSQVDPKFKDLFKDLDTLAERAAKKINKALASIDWDKARKKAETTASKIASAFNTFTKTIKWDLIGRTIAGGLNTSMAFVDTFVQKYKWKTLGTNLGTAFNSMIYNIDWELAGRYVTDGLRAAIKTAAALVAKIDFKTLGDNIGTMINSAIDNIPWTELGQLFNDSIIGVLDFLIHVENAIDTEKIKNAWHNAFSQIKWKEIFGKITELLSDSDQ